MKKLLRYFSVIVVAIIAFTGYYFLKEYHTYYKGYSAEVQKVKIERGSSVREIASVLKRKGVIRSDTTFVLFYKIFFPGEVLQAGTYTFTRPLRVIDVLKKLVKGEISRYKVVVPEGLTIEETAKVFEDYIPTEEFIKAAQNYWLIKDLDPEARDLEGYLFPDTYIFPEGASASLVVARMVRNFRKKFTPSMRMKAKEIGWTIRKVVTLASLIEKETYLDEEKSLISSVFHNRLRIGMPLQCDPTVVYAMKKMGIWKGHLLRKHYKTVRSPYNTYLHKGLPPGPICSPGIESIKAALEPADTKYLYFLAVGPSHIFSSSYSEHLKLLRERR